MTKPNKKCSEPMKVKYWSSAGLMLTYWCNARCPSCYVCSSPQRTEWMEVGEALSLWRGLVEASPHGCRVHLTGGEPFGDWSRLIELCRRAQSVDLLKRHPRVKGESLGKVETNAFWATDATIVRQRVEDLAKAGMDKLCISADPYHQQFVSIERCRLAAKIAGEVLGANRVQVRWRDWLADGFDTNALSDRQRAELMARYLLKGRERLGGRAVASLAHLLPREIFKTVEEIAADGYKTPCKNALLRSKHVHIGPGGYVMPGTCAGVLLGRAGQKSVAEVWETLVADWSDRPIVGALARAGPVALLPSAGQAGFVPASQYAGKCHLCWDIRVHLAAAGAGGQELGPRWMY